MVVTFLLSLPLSLTFVIVSEEFALFTLCTVPTIERSLAPSVQSFTAVAFTLNPVPESAPAKLMVSPTDICASEEPEPVDVTKDVEQSVVTVHVSVEAPAVVTAVTVLDRKRKRLNSS